MPIDLYKGNTITDLVTPLVIGSGRNDPNHRIPRQTYMREQDQYVPIANVIRIMLEANERCHQEHRKTITPEDVLYAMERLGFENYLEPLIFFMNKHQAQEMERNSRRAEPFTRRTINFVQS
ncbi:Nuclear transcription factor Y subunit B-9 [Forsythia ovata]|uniref:Nuclear transcription factor Y subunit B-9 n=1 Tax=Forsythia ovata TaxID=205694 RepID=A0ABD1PYZ4_9LAMI